MNPLRTITVALLSLTPIILHAAPPEVTKPKDVSVTGVAVDARRIMPEYAFTLITIWIALVILASILYRLSRGKPIFRPHFERPLFLETWRSGHSLRSLITRLGSARSCLWVVVSNDSLLVGPHFPFNLMFLPEINRLDYAIHGSAIRSVERREGSLSLHRNRVRVRLAGPSGDEEAFEVSLRDPDGFMRAVEIIRRAK